jgi:endothelin-converting enzyme/putative endopeptidase
MDETALEKRGMDDLHPDLAAIDDVRYAPSLLRSLAHLHKVGVAALFVFDSEVDFKDASHMIAGIEQGGLGLPERDYYLSDDAKVRRVRGEYLVHVARTLQLLGEPAPSAERHARTVVALETELAKASLTNVELRDPKNVYHRVDRDGLSRLAPDIPWDVYLERLGFPSIRAINVAAPEFVQRVDRLVADTRPEDWKVYLRWHLAAHASPWLSRRFVDEWFHLTQVLTGVKDLQPRWKRCVTLADQLMGEALARPFVTRYLGEEGKAAAQRMAAGIEASLQSDLESLEWMDAATRASALRKLAKILNKIGYPERWRDYSGLETSSTSLVQNVEHAREFELLRQLSKVGKPVDKNEWEMTPPTVNAYYDPTTNEMVFPAGILQAPFYNRAQSPALNFGAIGMGGGHELTHGCDD